ncbi:UNVERIFIED_CONTAM: hypothetical protein GTU68_053299 [Idotea baltica]|nr:hypothetical protein [Idotea baltica]
MFDWLLQVNIFMFFAILISFTYTLYTQPLTTYEIIGLVLSVGTIMGTSINVAHELGHRQTKFEQFLCKLMLMPNLYMHFFIEHNRGHHKNVATDEDPASSRKGEILYTFWFRSVIGGYLSAWNLETERLRNEGKAFFSVHNEMIWYHIIQVAYVITLLVLTSWWVTALTLWVGVMGVLLLETINYVEHYGLRRKKKESGRYERVKPHHSWNSNHEVGRIMLYELTRHSDHHFLASKKYQVLDHHAKAPHLPFGYPGSILMSTIPPLWFYVMHKELEKINPETAQLKSEFQVA